MEIVCYGIGNFAPPPRYSVPTLQLACALLVRRELAGRGGAGGSSDGSVCGSATSAKVEGGGGTARSAEDPFASDQSSARMFYYEPAMLPIERRILEEALCIEVVATNERGKRQVTGAGGSTFFFMPHCPMRLYSNVLWANWGPDLMADGKVIIFGNDFLTYDERAITGKERSDETNCVFQVLPFVESVNIRLESRRRGRIAWSAHDGKESIQNLERAFSDSSLTWFKKEGVVREDAQDSSDHTSMISWPDRPREYILSNEDQKHINDLI